MENEKIKWHLLEKKGDFSNCAMRGDSVSTIHKGEINGCEFLLFQTHEAYYNQNRSCMDYKIISSQVIPINK